MFFRKISCFFSVTFLVLPIFLNADKKKTFEVPIYLKNSPTIKPNPGYYTKNTKNNTLEQCFEKLNDFTTCPSIEEFQDLAAAYQEQNKTMIDSKKKGAHLSISSDTILNDEREKVITSRIQGPLVTATTKNFFNTTYSFLDNINKQIGNELTYLGLYEKLREFFSYITKYKNIIENANMLLQEKQKKASEQMGLALTCASTARQSFHNVARAIHKKFDINPWLGKRVISWQANEKKFYFYPQPGRDQQGRTPLHLAVSYGDVASVLILLVMGAHGNALDKDGKHPLFYLNPDYGYNNFFIVEAFLDFNPILAYVKIIRNGIETIFFENPSSKNKELLIQIMKIFEKHTDTDN